MLTENVVTVSTSSTPPPPCLQWKDVIVLYGGVERNKSDMGLVLGLREAGIPVWIMEDEDTEDVAASRSDVVWVTNVDRVLGLERKVVVCLGADADLYDRLHLMSRCTSQLVVVSPSRPGSVADAQPSTDATGDTCCSVFIFLVLVFRSLDKLFIALLLCCTWLHVPISYPKMFECNINCDYSH